ncbi:MAG: LysR family transcriptional regulator, partial [Mesorhizobium sp.]
SQTIKQLEARLGVRLLTRTTRSVAPTEAGERLYQSLLPRFEGIEADLSSLVAFRDKPSGTVRITLSDHALQMIVWPKLQPMLRDYPDLNVELYSVEKDMIAVRICPDWRLVAVASPDYFLRRPVPKTPQDLVGHECICLRQATFGGLYAWEFEKKGRELRVRVDGQLTFNTTIPMVDAALAGYGIAYVPEDLVSQH